MVGYGDANHIRWYLIIVLWKLLFLRCKTNRRSIVRSAESRIVTLITFGLVTWNIFREVSPWSRWRTRNISIVSPVPILIVERSIYGSISIVSIDWLIWALIIWPPIVRMVIPICNVWPWREILIRCGKNSCGSIIFVILISSLEILASIPLFWSMIWSSFFVVILSEGDFLLGSSFVFNALQFFVSYLSEAPTSGKSICAEVFEKSGCVLSYFLVWVFCSRISSYSSNSVLLWFWS